MCSLEKWKKVQFNKMYLEFSCPRKILVNPKLLLILEEIIFFFFVSSFQNSFLSPVESWRHKASLETKILSMAESGENFQHGWPCCWMRPLCMGAEVRAEPSSIKRWGAWSPAVAEAGEWAFVSPGLLSLWRVRTSKARLHTVIWPHPWLC